MQEIKKRRIVLASVLKPVDDTRMFEKIGQTLSGHAEVFIIGFRTAANPPVKGISFLPHRRPFGRVSLARLLAPWQILRQVFNLRPDTLVICTHELLVPAAVLKLLTGTRIYYDVQENYYLNIVHTKAFPWGLRGLLAAYVRCKERLLAGVIDHFILAEQIYRVQLGFVKGRSTIVENKSVYKATASRARRRAVSFLFSGTLAKSTGVLEAIYVAAKLHEADPEITLTIAGYIPTKDDFVMIENAVEGKPFIKLIGGRSLVPHFTINRLIEGADVGIVSYPPNPAVEGRIPTKLYEYMAFRLPILAVGGFSWEGMLSQYKAGMTYQTGALDAAKTLEFFTETDFYPHLPAQALWEYEAPKILEIFGYSNE